MTTAFIDPTFSVYRLVDDITTQQTLQHRRTMSRVSFTIENTTIKDRVRTRIFAGFQRMSKFIPQIARYNQLAAYAEHVYVFGVPDVKLPAIPDVTYIPLKRDDQLAKEWFLVSYSGDYYSALATEEISRFDDPDEQRVFRGVWTFDLPTVSLLHDTLTQAVGGAPTAYRGGSPDAERQAALMRQSIDRLSADVSHLDAQLDRVSAGEVKTLLKQNIAPALAAVSGVPVITSENEKLAAILFSDIRNFTRLSEQMPPRDLVTRVLTPYLETVTALIEDHGGKVDKFLGDGVLAVFDLDQRGTDPVIAAARGIVERVTALDAYVEGAIPVDVGVGVAAGDVVEGRISRSETTVIGDSVNTAQRLSAYDRNTVWMTADVYRRLTAREGVGPAASLQLRGKAAPVEAYPISRSN